MGKKVILFEIEKKDTICIIDTLSKYATIGGLSIKDSGLADREIYAVALTCKGKNINNCINSIVELSGNGIVVKRMRVV